MTRTLMALLFLGTAANAFLSQSFQATSALSKGKYGSMPPLKAGRHEQSMMKGRMKSSPGVAWADIAGLAFAKQSLQEAVILPSLRSDLFKGLRSPPKGVLLYGPPDAETRRALIVHLIEKHYRLSGRPLAWMKSTDALAETGLSSPSPTQKIASSPSMNPTSVTTSVSSTSCSARTVTAVDDNDIGEIMEPHIARIVEITEGYSGSDLSALCHEAAMGPIRELDSAHLQTVREEDVRSLSLKDFTSALSIIRPSVSADSLAQYVEWSEQFGVNK